MNTIAVTASALGIFLVVIVIAAFYQHVARPILLRALIYRIFAKRDALRKMVIESDLQASSLEFRYLQDFLCKSIALVPNLSILEFCKYSVHAKNQKPSPEMDYFDKNASDGLMKLRRESVEDVLAILVLNSPIVTVAATAVVIFLWVIGKVRTSRIFRATEGYVFNLVDPALA